MIDASIALSLLLMGLTSSPHCAFMCAANCSALCGTQARAHAGFHAGRMLSYAAAGALAAFSVGWLREVGAVTGALRPVWILLHVALLALGLWLLFAARWPDFLGRWGRAVHAGGAPRWGRATAAGLAWVAWPCGVLQGALLLAAMADSPLGGALGMAGFALASSPGLLLAPTLLRKYFQNLERAGWPTRVAGLSLAGASAWALSHGVWTRSLDVCT